VVLGCIHNIWLMSNCLYWVRGLESGATTLERLSNHGVITHACHRLYTTGSAIHFAVY
jgi:hypothetical protein